MNMAWIKKEFNQGLVSVIIPTYNRSKLLFEAVQSVISQSYRPIECIVVDDGSTDNTKIVLAQIATNVDNQFSIIYLFQVNSGVQIARNVGTIASSGEFIQYLDSDDLLYANKLKIQVDYLNNNIKCDGVFGDWQVGSIIRNDTIIAYKEDNFIIQLLTGRCIHTLSFLMRRIIVFQIGCWDINIKRNQEIDFQLQGLLLGASFNYLSLMCGLWRTHQNDRITNSTGLNEVIIFFLKWESILNNKKLLTPLVGKKLASLYWWLITENKSDKIDLQLFLLRKVVEFVPETKFINTPKFKFLSFFIGNSLSLKLWLYKFRMVNFYK